MEAYAILLGLVGVMLLFWGWVLIVIAAFREQTAWGVFVLLIPPVSLVFAIGHWDKAHPGVMRFLVATPLLVLGTAGAGIGDSSTDPSLIPDDQQREITIYVQDKVGLDSPDDDYGSDSDSDSDPDLTDQEPAWDVPEPGTEMDSSSIINLNRAAEFVGRQVVFTRANGDTFDAVLLAVDGSTVTVKERVGDGFMEYPIPKTELSHFRPSSS